MDDQLELEIKIGRFIERNFNEIILVSCLGLPTWAIDKDNFLFGLITIVCSASILSALHTRFWFMSKRIDELEKHITSRTQGAKYD